MTAVHKKHETTHKQEPKEKVKQAEKSQEIKPEPIIVTDVVTETTERIEVVEADPLSDFKEKMQEEEKAEVPVSDVPPKKNFMWPILFVVFIALILLIGTFLYKQGMTQGEKINVVTLSPTPTVAPEPTKAKVDLSKYEIRILNGSEAEGEAGRQRVNLEEEGFTVASVGNADTSDYTATIIQAKKEVDQDFLNKLMSVLELSFAVGEQEELAEDADSDIVVIIGSETN